LGLQIIIDIESFLMSNKFLIIDSRPYGLFSIFLHTIDCLKWAEDNGYTPVIRWGSGRVDPNKFRSGASEASLRGDPKFVTDKENFVTDESLVNNKRSCLYADKEEDNVWDYYFHSVGNLDGLKIEDIDYKIADIFMCGELDFNLENKFLINNLHSYDRLKLWNLEPSTQANHRKEVNQIIKKYVKIKDHITNKVESFYNKKVKNNDVDFVIGAHIRGTDKRTEFPYRQLTIDDYIKTVNEILETNKDKKCKIYIASDNNESILDFFITFGKDKVIAFPSNRMPNFIGNTPICLSPNIDKKKHGEETLIETLLLSKCDVIIGTDSNVTAGAAYINPESTLIYLDRIRGVR